MDSGHLSVLGDRELLDGLISPMAMLSLRVTCRSNCRDLHDYLVRFLRTKFVRANSVYESEKVLDRDYTINDLFQLARFVYGQLEMVASVSLIRSTCAGSFAMHWYTEREAMVQPFVEPCAWLPGDIDVFCQDETELKESMDLITVFHETIGSRGPIKWAGLNRFGPASNSNFSGSHYEFGMHAPNAYIGADELYGSHPVADTAAFLAVAQDYPWSKFVASDSFSNQSSNEILALLAASLPGKVVPKNYKVIRSVHASIQLELPTGSCRATFLEKARPRGASRGGRAWFTINLVHIVDVRPFSRMSKGQLTTSDIIESFDTAVAAVSMTVDLGLNINFQLSPTLLLQDVRTKKMRLTNHFLFGIVPPTEIVSPPRWDRRHDDDGMEDDLICDRCLKVIPDFAPLTGDTIWQAYAAVGLVLDRVDKYLSRGYTLAVQDEFDF